MAFRPMLAVDFDERRMRFPYHATPKLDGIRCVALNGVARTRSLKPFPNEHTDEWFRSHAKALEGLDGELVVGDPTASDCFNRTASGLMSIAGRPEFNFFVFDLIDFGPISPARVTGRAFADRAREAETRVRSAGLGNVFWLPDKFVESTDELRRAEDVILEQGYEGVMLRSPGSLYKFGRATVSENSLLKVKRFRDAEAIIVGIEEQMHNTNPAMRNELGRTKRSSAQAGKVGKDTFGAFVVKGAPGQPFAGVQFKIGTGMDDALRAELWRTQARLPGKRVRYRFFELGSKDAPRFPSFAGFREEGV